MYTRITAVKAHHPVGQALASTTPEPGASN